MSQHSGLLASLGSYAGVLETAGCPTRGSLAAPKNEPVSTTQTSTSIEVNRSTGNSSKEYMLSP